MHAQRGFLSRQALLENGGSLKQLEPVAFPEGSEQLSEEIDSVVYGTGEP